MGVFGARLGEILNTPEDGGVDEDSQQLSVKVCVCVAWIAGDIPNALVLVVRHTGRPPRAHAGNSTGRKWLHYCWTGWESR